MNKNNLEEKQHFILKKLKNTWREQHYGPRTVHCHLRMYFPWSYSWNKAKVSVSSAWWPLNRGDSKGRTLVGNAKRWPRPPNRGLSSHSFFYSFFRTLITGLTVESINRVNPLNPKIKIWILICCPHSFHTEVVGRSWKNIKQINLMWSCP